MKDENIEPKPFRPGAPIFSGKTIDQETWLKVLAENRRRDREEAREMGWRIWEPEPTPEAEKKNNDQLDS